MQDILLAGGKMFGKKYFDNYIIPYDSFITKFMMKKYITILKKYRKMGTLLDVGCAYGGNEFVNPHSSHC